jgi:hypothetical protein
MYTILIFGIISLIKDQIYHDAIEPFKWDTKEHLSKYSKSNGLREVITCSLK